MTLMSTMHLAKSALQATQLGIQVAGNNIANAETPGYVRERLLLEPGPTQRNANITTGTGVRQQAVVRQVDQFLQQRLRAAASDMGNGQVQEQVFSRLEAVIGELTDEDLSSYLTGFFNSVNDVLNQPEDLAARGLSVLNGDTLAEQIRQLHSRVTDLRTGVNDQVADAVAEANRTIQGIAVLNKKIVDVELAGHSPSDAVGLRDKRDKAIEDLAKVIDIQVEEQPNGSINILVSGSYLIFDESVQTIEMTDGVDRDSTIHQLQLSKTKATFAPSSGELAGFITARDETLGGYLETLDDFAGTLIFEFNQLHSSGQGMTGFQELTADNAVTDADSALDAAGLTFVPRNGSFQVVVQNTETGVKKTHDLSVHLQGLDDDTTLNSLAADLDAIDGLTAQIDRNGRLVLGTEASNVEFGFADDSSGVLASLGVNSFFSGTRASDIGVNQQLREDPSKLAVSQGGFGNDTRNGELMANMLHSPLASRNDESLAQVYEQWVSETAQAAALTTALSEGFSTFHATLEGEHLGLSGVSLDEEAIDMMSFQRSFQAAARVITTVSELLEELIRL